MVLTLPVLGMASRLICGIGGIVSGVISSAILAAIWVTLLRGSVA